MSKSDLFYSQAELLNFALHKLGVEVYEIVAPKKSKHLYAIINETNKRELDILDKCGFPFYCVNPHPLNDGHSALWIQFRNTFD